MPDDIHAFIGRDAFAKFIGVELLDVGEGRAQAQMAIGPHHLNGMGRVHGAAIFGLADLAFAAACNSHGPVAMAINVSINYIKGVTEGVLHADAYPVSVNPRLGTYTVNVTDDAGDIVAVFQGLAYRRREKRGGEPQEER